MTVFQGTAKFVGYGLFEQYNVDSPRVGNRLFNKIWGEYAGISAPPEFASGGPEADPAVKALNAQYLKQQGVPKL